MDQYHRSHKKKVSAGTGGRKRKNKDKKRAHVGGTFAATKAGDKSIKRKTRTRGGNQGIKLKKADKVNVVSKSGVQNVEIQTVLESHNPEYVRMKIITRGAILGTKIGKVRVTNRVGQDGIINAVLLDK